MKYIYDLIVNFNSKLYPFYDWYESDILENIKKIPIIKVKEEVLLDLKNNNFLIDKELLKNIYNKTEIFNKNKSDIIKYGILIGTDNEVIGFIFDDKGYAQERTSLLVDEELDILELIEYENITNIKYNIISKIDNSFLLREDEKVINKCISILNNLKNKNKEEELKYLYYEWFNRKVKTNNYYNLLINSIKKESKEKVEEFMDIINLVNT